MSRRSESYQAISEALRARTIAAWIRQYLKAWPDGTVIECRLCDERWIERARTAQRGRTCLFACGTQLAGADPKDVTEFFGMVAEHFRGSWILFDSFSGSSRWIIDDVRKIGLLHAETWIRETTTLSEAAQDFEAQLPVWARLRSVLARFCWSRWLATHRVSMAQAG